MDNPKAASNRLFAPDALRGLIMVLMALDHANYFVAQQHSCGENWGGPFPQYTAVLPFLTRFVTHFSAPGFFFLMGAGMFLFARSRQEQGWSRAQVVRHFVLRGLVLVALQLLVVNRAWEMSPGWVVDTYIGVLFALGLAMIFTSALLWLDSRLLLSLALIFFLGTETLAPDPGAWGQFRSPLELIFLTPGGTAQLWSNYPLLPWIELVLFGVVFGSWLHADAPGAYRTARILGLSFLAGFFILRQLDGFGNIRPMEGSTPIDFFNPVKYPPSMTFTLLTMGFNLLFLSWFSRLSEKARRLLRPLEIFGQAPLFFYLAHLFLYALLGRWFAPNGSPIIQMLPYWLLGLLILLPLCRGYQDFKGRQPPDSILQYF